MSHVVRATVAAALSALCGCVIALQPGCGLGVTGTSAVAGDAGSASDGASGAASLEGPSQCPADHGTCSGACVDLTSDPQNCGQCGKACAANEGCAQSTCSLLCGAGTTACGGACVNVAVDPKNCGGCGAACGAPLLCSAGACKSTCDTGFTRCAGKGGAADYCADFYNDVNNCGVCGGLCASGKTCTAGACVSFCATGGVIGDVYATNMIGCVGHVTFDQRATLCAPGVAVCSAADYRARRGNKAPKYNYWTNDDLRGRGVDGNCAAAPAGARGFNSCTASTPMHVCGAYTDKVGNPCNAMSCGFNGNSPNEYFGGCTNNTTAGVLCCPP